MLVCQTYADWEWVVVDDGSTDDSLDVLMRIAAIDERVRVIPLSENKGRGYARNIAFDNAKGDFIVIWDVDDIYLPNRLLAINQALVGGFDYFCSYALVADGNDGLVGARHFLANRTRFSGNTNHLVPSFVHPSLAFRADLLGTCGYDPSMKSGEDLEFMLYLENCCKGFYCEEYLMVYVEGENVELRKSIDVHLSQYVTRKKVLKDGIISLDLSRRISFQVSFLVKYFILLVLMVRPSIYSLFTRFRYREPIVLSKLIHSGICVLPQVSDSYGGELKNNG